MNNDYFKNKSKEYEKDSKRVDNVNNIADAIIEKNLFNKSSKIMDFGSGTGLLTAQIAPQVKKITTIDISASMNEKIKSKIPDLACEIEVLNLDLSTHDLENRFDGIISSMTIHHIQDVQALFHKFYKMLNKNSSIAIADLEVEDGTFHTEDTGIYHLGFEHEEFVNYAKIAGFTNVDAKRVSIAKKPYGEYPIFLLTATKA
jgi:2-polyprenyl-3-methyl-5-hydroxy-6-metoxy-1,4-benzoquinol methylase